MLDHNTKVYRSLILIVIYNTSQEVKLGIGLKQGGEAKAQPEPANPVLNKEEKLGLSPNLQIKHIFQENITFIFMIFQRFFLDKFFWRFLKS